MDVSIIIPTYNAQKYLPALLERLSTQTLSFELIIIDSSSTDNTLDIAKQYTEHIISIPKSQFDHGGTRTQAAKYASGEIIIFLTQDALPIETQAIERLINVFDDKKIGVAYGRQIPYESTSIFGKHLRAFNYPVSSYVRTLKDKEQYGMRTAFLSDSFSAYRKSAMSEVEWFKDGLIVGEDAHITSKLLLSGYKVAYIAEAVVYHSHSYTLAQDFGRYFDTGVFHTMESWILETFGKAEGEGMRYIKSEFSYLLKHQKHLRIPEFFLRNGLKFIGYKLGKNYQKLPLSLVKRLSMHTPWWSK